MDGRGQATKEGIFMARSPPQGLNPQLVYWNYLPNSASFGVKRIMHYITFLLFKTS